MKNINLLKSFSYLATTFLFLLNLSLNAQTIIQKDSVTDFLTDYKGIHTVAEIPPAIDFGVIDIGKANPSLPFTHWGNVVLGPDDKFYYAIGDHNISGNAGTVILKSYDPKTQTDEICIYSPDVTPKLADGKWHGRPVINPNTGDMYLTGFYGGQIVKYNIYTKNVTNYGKAVPGMGWEEHIWDYERNRLYGVNSHGSILIYNTENNTVVFSGQPFSGFNTNGRSRLVDYETGIFYATGNDGMFYNYNPLTNVFTELNSNLPNALRANTNTKETDGSFWVTDFNGNMFRFFPENDLLVSMGLNAEDGEYVAFMERSLNGNYVYYISAGSGGHLIQLNAYTGERKVIAELPKYYSKKYDFLIMQFFGGALSRDNNSILLVCYGLDSKGNKRPAMFHVHIPEANRVVQNTSIISDSITIFVNPVIKYSFNNATLKGIITSNKDSIYNIKFEYGINYSFDNIVNTISKVVYSNTTDSVRVNIVNLKPDTEYNYRMKVTYKGTEYISKYLNFKTLPEFEIGLNKADKIYYNEAVLSGKIVSNDTSITDIEIQYGIDTLFSNSIDATPHEVLGQTEENISGHLTSLMPNTKYYARIKAIYKGKNIYSSIIIFKTQPEFIINISNVFNANPKETKLSGVIISNNYNITDIEFEYGVDTLFSNSIIATPNTVIGGTKEGVTAQLSSLKPETKYYARIKAIYNGEEKYSSIIKFTTKPESIINEFNNSGNFVNAFIYPNPINDYLNIESSEFIERVEFIDSKGKLLFVKTNQNSINISDYSNGLYFVKIYTNNTLIIKKIVKK